MKAKLPYKFSNREKRIVDEEINKLILQQVRRGERMKNRGCSPTTGHKRGKNTPCYIVYTVWNNRTDELVICDGTAPECAKAMGIKVGSFFSIITGTKNGRYSKWTIEPTYLEGRDRARL